MNTTLTMNEMEASKLLTILVSTVDLTRDEDVARLVRELENQGVYATYTLDAKGQLAFEG